MEIHELLREIREASKKESGKKITQEDCAEYLDISTRQYIKYETGEAKINAVNFFKVCALCRI